MNSIVTRTLLLTDIVGSTALVEALGDERAAAILAQVDRVVRDAVAETRGVEIDKTDGFLVLFDRAVDAVRCATRIHKGLEALSAEVKRPMAMRAGINVGEVVLRNNAPEDVARGAKPIEVEGLAKPMAARIMSLARGGQTLLTRPAHELASRASIGDDEISGIRYTAHGLYHLSGISEAIEVYEVGFQRPRRPAESDKVRRARKNRWLPAAAGFVALVAVSAAIGWQFRPQRHPYTTLDEPAHVSNRSAQQTKFVAAWQAFGEGNLRDARRQVDALAAELPAQADVRLTQVAFTLADQRRVPAKLQQEIAEQLKGVTGPDAELLAFVERWKVEGWAAAKLHDEIHAFRDRYPDHLIGLLLAIELHQEQQRADESRALIDALSASKIAEAAAWRLRADEQVRRDDYSGAQQTLDEGLARFPNHPALAHSLAVLRWERGDAAGALALVEPLLADDPNHLAARSMAVSALLALGREPEVEPHIAILRGPTVTPDERVRTTAALASSFSVEGRQSRARELLAMAYFEAKREGLADAWVDVALLDLRWALDPDLSTSEQRTAALDRAEQALLEPWMSDVAGRRLREHVASARSVEAWLAGDPDAARERGNAIAERGAMDALGAGFVIAILDDAAGTLPADGGCATTLAAGEVWFHNGQTDLSAPAFAAARSAPCEGLHHLQPERAAAEAHLASIAAEKGLAEVTADHVAMFRARWPRADADLPVSKEIAAAESRFRERAAPGPAPKGKHKKDRKNK